jgi:hypothetical protein
MSLKQSFNLKPVSYEIFISHPYASAILLPVGYLYAGMWAGGRQADKPPRNYERSSFTRTFS